MTRQSQQGYTIIELLTYVAILVVVLIALTTATVALSKPLMTLRNTRAVNEAGALTADRIAKEIRRGVEITSPGPNDSSQASITFKVPMSFAERVKKDDAISHWNFEQSEGQLVDQIGMAHGDVTNVSDRDAPGIVGRGFTFNGINSIVNLPNNTFTYAEGAIEAIVKPDNGPTGMRAIFAYFDIDMPASSNIFGIGGIPSPNFVTGFAGINNSAALLYSTDSPIVSGVTIGTEATTDLGVGEYHHLVWQKSISADKYTFYVDGAPKATYLAGNDVSGSTMNQWYWLNSFPAWEGYAIGGGGSHFFPGIIDEIAFYKTPKDLGVWKNHYDAAWGNDNANNLRTQTISVVNGQIALASDGGAPDALSNTRTTITNLSYEPVVLNNKTVGVRYSFTATAGSGATAVTKSFRSGVMMRNPE